MPVYVDISRCIGCRSCEVACKRVHGGKGHVNVHMAGDHASVPIFCHHCEEATCTMACFSGALYKDGERTAFAVEKCTGSQVRPVPGPRDACMCHDLPGQCPLNRL